MGEIRGIAVGRENIEKYKNLLLYKSNTYISIDWNCPSPITKLIKKMKQKFQQSIKNYSMVNRLKSIRKS